MPVTTTMTGSGKRRSLLKKCIPRYTMAIGMHCLFRLSGRPSSFSEKSPPYMNVMHLIQLIKRLKTLVGAGFLSVLAWALGLNIVFAAAFYFAERSVQEITMLDALWWSMVTMTTVGYGDFSAQTWIGRFIISYPCMLLGIGIIGYLVGFIANALIEFASKKRRGLMEITFDNHIIVCNFPGEEKIIKVIHEITGSERYRECRFVLITDKLEELPEKLQKMKIHFVRGIPTDTDVLLRANLLSCRGVIVLAERPEDRTSDERTYTICSLVELLEREHKRPIKTIAEVVSKDNIKNLQRTNVDGFISSEGIVGCLLVQEFLHPGINGVISQMVTNLEGSQLYIHETTLDDYPIQDVQIGAIRHEDDIQVIGVIQNGRQILNPPRDTRVGKGDKLIILAQNEHDIQTIEQQLMQTTASS
ncbi:MAG: hypothetical protein GF398_15645 [Chitinivibrionales bacterium]|nr:hypothetical protein [Chitinivibrionales bacterium]